jgi:hypothetical protein
MGGGPGRSTNFPGSPGWLDVHNCRRIGGLTAGGGDLFSRVHILFIPFLAGLGRNPEVSC